MLSDGVFGALYHSGLDLLHDSIQAAKDLWTEFPNVWKMGNVIVRYSTSMVGRLVNLPLDIVANGLVGWLRFHRLHNRLIRLDEVVFLLADSTNHVLRNVTLTDSSGIVGVASQWLARFLWRWIKQVRFLSALLKVGSEEEFVNLIISKLKRRVRFFLWVALIILILATLTFISGYMALWLLGWSFYSERGDHYLLSQDSKRVWRKTRHVVRVNRGRGPDKPNRSRNLPNKEQTPPIRSDGRKPDPEQSDLPTIGVSGCAKVGG